MYVKGCIWPFFQQLGNSAPGSVIGINIMWVVGVVTMVNTYAGFGQGFSQGCSYLKDITITRFIGAA